MLDFLFAAVTALVGAVLTLLGRHGAMWPESRDSLAMTLRGIVLAVGLLFLVIAAVNTVLIERAILFPVPQAQQALAKP